MKRFALLLMLVPLVILAKPRLDSAVIRMVQQPGVSPAGEIVSIDGRKSPDATTSTIYMSGKRVVGYRCPGVRVTSPPALLQMDLQGGMVYELVCQGARASVRVSSQTWP